MGIIKSGGICHVLIPDWPIVNTNIVNCLASLDVDDYCFGINQYSDISTRSEHKYQEAFKYFKGMANLSINSCCA